MIFWAQVKVLVITGYQALNNSLGPGDLRDRLALPISVWVFRADGEGFLPSPPKCEARLVETRKRVLHGAPPPPNNSGIPCLGRPACTDFVIFSSVFMLCFNEIGICFYLSAALGMILDCKKAG